MVAAHVQDLDSQEADWRMSEPSLQSDDGYQSRRKGRGSRQSSCGKLAHSIVAIGMDRSLTKSGI